MRETFTSGSVGRAPGNRCLYPEADCLQRPLVPRCRFRQQVSPGIRCQVRGGKTKESISEFRRGLGEQIRYTVGHIVHFLAIA